MSELTTLVNVCIRAKREFWNPVAKFDINPQEILCEDNVEKEGGEIAFMKGEEQEEETKVRVFGRLGREGHQSVEEIDHGTCPALW